MRPRGALPFGFARRPLRPPAATAEPRPAVNQGRSTLRNIRLDDVQFPIALGDRFERSMVSAAIEKLHGATTGI